MISAASRNATSSPASESGATRCDAPAGPTLDLFGQEVAPASHFPAPAKAMSSQMSAIYGRLSSGSSESAALSLALASRLQARTRSLGSTMFQLTWKARATPSGRSIPALRASALRTSGSGFTSWPTATKEDARASARHGYMITGNQGTTLLDAARISTWATPRAEDGESSGMPHARGAADTLTAQSSLASPWATPSSRDWKDSPGMATTGTDPDGSERSRLDQLPRQANLMIASPRATPNSADAKNCGGTGTSSHKTLCGDVLMLQASARPTPKEQNSRGPSPKHDSLWDRAQLTASARPTPDCYEGNTRPNGKGGKTIMDCVQSMDSGATQNGSPAATVKPGQLNPALPRWLMGLPIAWDDCAATVTRSVRRSRKSS